MWLERIVYKVRMNAAGILLEEYRHALGAKSGVDGAFLNHFFLTLANIEAIALLPDDEAAAAFLRFPGVTPEKIAFWNEIAPNLGLKGFPMEGRVSMALSGPYKHLKDKFNIRGALRFSEESGCSEPSRGVYKRTALGATYDSLGSERYMLTEDNRDLRDIAGAVPYDAVFVMVNQKRYGGGGIYNFYCTFATDNQWSPYIFLHEFGHSFAGLADEYFTSSVAYVDLPPTTVEPREPNVTVLLKGRPLKWADLATAGTPVPTPWEKAGFEVLDLGLQKEREALNKRIAARMREGAPQEEVDAIKAQAEELSAEHAKLIDAYLAKSKFKGQVGAFEGANYIARGFYRPALDCIMFTKGAKPFCPVCARAIERTIARYGE